MGKNNIINIELKLESITAYHIGFVVNYCENVVNVALFLFLLNSTFCNSQVKCPPGYLTFLLRWSQLV